jgi:hypothetical protein
MFSIAKRQGFASIALSGVLFDPKIRRAALGAAPPVARLGWLLGRRAAERRTRQHLDQVIPAVEQLAALTASVVPHVLAELGLVEAPKPRRRLAPKATALAAVGAAAVYLLEPGRGQAHRRQLARLIVH